MVARMRRINIVIDPALDDRLEREAAARNTSKSALVQGQSYAHRSHENRGRPFSRWALLP